MTTEPQTLEQMAESLLAPQDTPETETPDEDQIEVEVDESDEVDEAELDEETDDSEDETDDADEDDDESEQETNEQPQTFKVKVDGQETEVTLDELTRGYAGQAYIQKGMTETAEMRKQTEAQFNALNQQRQALSELVQNLQNGHRAPTAPDKSLLHSDPIAYFEAKGEYDDALAEYNQTNGQIQHQQAQAHAAEQAARQAYVQEQQAILSQRIPEFGDPQKGAALQQRLRDVGIEYGFAEQEMTGITDARHVQVLHDAMRYRDLVSKKAEVTAKAAKARPVVKAGAKKVQNPVKAQREKQRQRLRQSGSVNDAIDLMFET